MYSQKAEQLQIRASAVQKAKLAEAARAQHMNVSQFVLSTSLQAADEILADQTRLTMGEAAFAEFQALMDAPPRIIPEFVEQYQKAKAKS